jgi:hypothetical protein
MIQVYFDTLFVDPGYAVFKWAPMIKVSLSVPTGFLGAGPRKIIQDLRCLIDTGSYECGIDADIADKNNIPKGSPGFMHGSAGQAPTVERLCDIVFDETTILPATLYTTSLHHDHAQFDLMIGMVMLKNFEFHLKAAEPSAELRYLRPW